MLVDHPSAGSAPGAPVARRWRETPLWNRFTPLQLVVMALATIGPLVILVTLTFTALGAVSAETARDVALGAGEDPGMLVFGAMFLAGPMQWWTGRSQIRVRKYLGIVFFLLALSNGAMFIWEKGFGELGSSVLVVTGLIGLVLAAPLFLTSSRLSQRLMGMRRWRLLHKLTYVVAVALVAHALSVAEGGPGLLLILSGFVLRIPAVRRRLQHRGSNRRSPRTEIDQPRLTVS